MPVKDHHERARQARWLPAALLGVLGLFLTIPASAESPRPFWTEQAMFQFGDDLFFVGQASCADTPEEGRQRAFAHGLQELLNYAQTRSVRGLLIATQMIFEDPSDAACQTGRVTVWRLLRLDEGAIRKLQQQTREQIKTVTTYSERPVSPPLPSIGMSRDEIFQRFGLPRSITMGQRKYLVWDYPQFGWTVEFDRQLVLRRWHRSPAAARSAVEVAGGDSRNVGSAKESAAPMSRVSNDMQRVFWDATTLHAPSDGPPEALSTLDPHRHVGPGMGQPMPRLPY